MTPTKDRVIVKEFAEVAAHYARYNQACASGKVTLALFWGQLRHQLCSKQLDGFLQVGCDLLLAHAMTSPRSATPTLSFSFTYADSETKAECDGLSQRLRLTKAETIKLLLVANTLRDASQDNAPLTPLQAAASTVTAAQAPAPAVTATALAQVDGAAVIEFAPTEKIRFCEETQAWLIFKPARLDKSMTQKQLMEVHTWGGLYLPMTPGESEARGLTPRPVVVAPVTESDCDDSHDELYAGAAGYSSAAQAAVRPVAPQPSKPVEAQSDISMARQLAGMQSMFHVFEKLAGKS